MVREFTNTERLMLLAMLDNADKFGIVVCDFSDLMRWAHTYKSSSVLYRGVCHLVEAGMISLPFDTTFTQVNFHWRKTRFMITENGQKTARSFKTDGGVILGRVDYPEPETWKKIRAQVWARDRFTCQYCGIKDVPLTADHIVPLSRGGTNDMANLATACVSCNRSKRNFTVAEWYAKMGRELSK